MQDLQSILSTSIDQTLNKQSIIDNRQDKLTNIDKSTIDYKTSKLREKMNDPGLGEAMVAKALKYLGEHQVDSISDYAVRKGNNPGAVFVKICQKELAKVVI